MKRKNHQEKQYKQVRTYNPEKQRLYYLKKKEKDPGYYIRKEMARRTSIQQMTPGWANEFFISEIYDLACRRRKATGFGWDVDHIIPRKGKLVSGLHAEDNLRVIPSSENRRKFNAFQQELCQGLQKRKCLQEFAGTDSPPRYEEQSTTGSD